MGVCLTEPCVLDVGFFLEGAPRILGCVRVSGLDLALAEPLLFSPPSPPPAPNNTPMPETNTREGAGTPAVPAVAAALKEGEMPLGNLQFGDTWEDNSETHKFKVRGPGYLSGGGKVDAGKPFGRFIRADLYKVCGMLIRDVGSLTSSLRDGGAMTNARLDLRIDMFVLGSWGR